MKKLNRKKNIFKIFSIFMLGLAVIVSAVFSVGNKHKKDGANAVTTIYADAESYLSGYATETGVLPDTFDLSDTYPIMPENQVNTDLCWIYASQKALETCLMVEANEYHNFSELATAMFAYQAGQSATINTTGTFEKFNYTTQNYGLVFESDFSNDNVYDVSEDNFDNYSYVFDLATDNISHAVKPIVFTESATYDEADLDKKIEIIKRFVMEHGGLYLGLEPGAIYSGNNGATYEKYVKGVNDDAIINSTGKYFLTGHAVTIIGYNEYGFVALNSWGVESNSYKQFYVPYDYLEMYNNIYGYVHIEDKNEVELVSTTATKFATTILPSTTPMKNLFCYGEEVRLVYNIHEEIDFEGVFVNIAKNQEDLTSKFTIEYDDTARTVSILLNQDSTFFVGGTYVIRVYEDINLMATESFSVYTGTEVAYFKMTKTNVSKTIEGYSMLSASETSENVMTFYVSALQSYQLNFHLTSLNSREYDGSSLIFSFTEAYVYFTENGEEKRQALNWNLNATDNNNIDNRYSYTFNNLSSYAGKRIEFAIRIRSTHYTSLRRSYYVNLIVSSYGTTTTTLANSVEYMLDGGINSQYNVLRYPNYALETAATMTKFTLHNPTKFGYNFMGWYLDENFENSILEINSVNAGDLVVYAKWERTDEDYFKTNLEIGKLTDYSGTSKAVSEKIVYGDSVTLKYTFTPLSSLEKYNYLLKLYYYVNGEFESEQVLQSKAQSIDYTLAFPELVVGDYDIKVVTAIVVTHQFSVSSENEYSFSTQKKEISITFNNAESIYEYDGEEKSIYSKLLCDSGRTHENNAIEGKQPSLTLGGVYAEDHDAFVYTISLTSAKNYGSYNYHVNYINNDNYSFDSSAFGVLVIKKKLLTISWANQRATYDATAHSITYTLNGVVGEDIVSLTIANGVQTNAGKYIVSIEDISNNNYYVDMTETAELEILKTQLILAIPNVTDRIQISPVNRKKITYTIQSGVIYGEDELNITLNSEGLTSTKSGTYDITGTAGNDNYEVVIYEGKYVLTGYYYVYYTLPNGEIYTEIVGDGKKPKGIDSSIYKIPFLHAYKYSQKLENTGEDLHITVTVKNYTWVVVGVAVVIVFVAVYWFVTRKARRNRVS